MPIVEVKVPQLSESVAEATLLQWKKKPGEAVALDEILIEIETDKVVLEVPAPAAGVIAQLVKQDGESCVSDEVIAKIDTEGTAAVSPLEVKGAPAPSPAPAVAPAPGRGSSARCSRCRTCRNRFECEGRPETGSAASPGRAAGRMSRDCA